MPAKSGKQYRLMQAVAHGAKIDAGPSKEVAKKFIAETPKKKRSIFQRTEEREKNKMKPPNNMLGVRG